MEKYLGVKVVSAESMTQHEFVGDGTSIKKLEVDQAGYKVTYEDGYTSWSPKEVFEKAYRRIDQLTFGLAIEALKQGKKVARAGWNGKGMWLKLVPALNYAIVRFNDKEENINAVKEVLPWIGMKTADNCFVPWLASQTDMLAEDWVIIE